MSIQQLMRKDLLNFENYEVKGQEARFRLNNNELPWSPVQFNTLSLNHYPDYREVKKLNAQLADYYGINPKQLVITRGSDEGIDYLMRLCLTPSKEAILQCPPTFSMYQFFANLQNAAVINCPLNPQDFSLDLEALLKAWTSTCKLIFLCSPNNPTGNIIPLLSIATLCEQFKNKALIVVDEAYLEFSDALSATSLLAEFENLIILRTLSKGLGLAGLRIGAIIANEEIIKTLGRIIPPYSLSSPVIYLAQEALRNLEFLDQRKAEIIAERTRLIAKFKTLSSIERVYPSEANFILVKTSCAQILYNKLLGAGIAVKALGDSGSLKDHLRITVGKTTENDQVLSVLA